MILLLHARNALRRAWTAPLRSLSVLATSAAAWAALFGLASDALEAQGAARSAGLINGAQAWRVAIAKTHQDDVGRRRAVLPPELVDALRPYASAVVLRAASPIRVGDASRVLGADLLFYELAGRAPAQPVDSFPPCALIGAPSLGAALTFARLRLGRDWRCRAAPLPAALAVLATGRTTPAIVLPLAAMTDIAGPRARERIDTVWVGIDDKALMTRLLAPARARYALDLNIYAYGAALKASVAEASNATRLAKAASALGLCLALGFYVHGVFGAMRRELALRTCLGHSFARILAWLQADVWTQALCMSLLSCALGAALHAARYGHMIDHDALLLAGAIHAAIAAVFVPLCAGVTVLVFRHGRAVQLASK
jgi:hypothetical protein